MKNCGSGLPQLNKRGLLTLGLFLIGVCLLYGQDRTNIDSLEAVLQSGKIEAPERLDVLRTLSQDHQDPQKLLTYSMELIASAEALDSTLALFDGFLQKGSALRLKSDLPQALDSYFQAKSIAIAEKFHRQLGKVNIAIADVYSIMGNHQNAVDYYKQAIVLLKEENDSIGVATALLNAGDEYFNQNKLDSAMLFFQESEEIFRNLNFEVGVAYNLGNVGMIYAEQGKDQLALTNLDQAIKILEEVEDYYPISVYMTYLSDIYLKDGQWETAMEYSKKSLELAQDYGLKDQISAASLQISELLELAGNLPESFRYYKQHIIYKDSVANLTLVQRMANMRTDFEIAQKQIEVDLLNQQKENQKIIVIAVSVALFLIGLLAFGLYRRYLFIKRTNLVIEQERSRSENLLLNILPKETAQELKEFGKVNAHKFESVTVLFTDFEGFTFYAESLPPEKLVEGVDYYFSKFDEIMDQYGLEKIKTVGDAYMCAGGLPFPSGDHACQVVLAALEIADFVKKSKEADAGAANRFNVRIGINTGPVIAGVVGTKKFSYDIWGDAVNIASRMESNSEPGQINISENTYELIKHQFECKYRGEIAIKNRGPMKMYYVLEYLEKAQFQQPYSGKINS